MNIELHRITVRELAKGYADNSENGVRAYGGKLNVRSPFQREFVYKEKQRDTVIDTLTQGFPLNVIIGPIGTHRMRPKTGRRTHAVCPYKTPRI